MSTRTHHRQIQGRSHSVHNAYEELQDAIFAEKGVKCSVLVTPQYVSIRTSGASAYVDYVMAKAAIRGRVSVEIVQG